MPTGIPTFWSTQCRAKSYKYIVQKIMESVVNFPTCSQIISFKLFRSEKVRFSLHEPSLLKVWSINSVSFSLIRL